jgi:peptidoglycan/xylan/chitin deacetylase (PgdA/CDA1 family)
MRPTNKICVVNLSPSEIYRPKMNCGSKVELNHVSEYLNIHSTMIAVCSLVLFWTSLSVLPYDDVFGRKAVVLTFDDGWKDQITNAVPILNKYGFNGTFFIVCNYVGTDNSRMTWEDISELNKLGYDIESHTMNHKDLTKLSKKDLEYEIGAPKQCLREHGIPNSTIFATPFNAGWNNDSVVNMTAKYYDIGRSGNSDLMFLNCDKWTKDQKDCQTYYDNGTLTFANRYTMRGWSHNYYDKKYAHDANRTLEEFIRVVERQTKYNTDQSLESLPIIIYHKIDNENKDTGTTATEVFEKEMKYLHDNGYTVLAMSDFKYDTNSNKIYVNELGYSPRVLHSSNRLMDVEKHDFGGIFTISANNTLTSDTSTSNDSLPATTPPCKCVVFRMDDIQDYWIDNAQIAAMNLFISKNQSLSLGLIMNITGKDGRLIGKIAEGSQRGLFELGLHGWDHVDYTTLSEEQQRSTLHTANKKMLELFGNSSDIFIPPYTYFDSQTINAMSDLGIKVLSSEKAAEDDYDGGDSIYKQTLLNNNNKKSQHNQSIYHLPGIAELVRTVNGNAIKPPLAEILSDVFTNLQEYGYAVIVFHPQDLVLTYENGTVIHNAPINVTRMGDLSQLVDTILSKNINITTFSDITDIERRSYSYFK